MACMQYRAVRYITIINSFRSILPDRKPLCTAVPLLGATLPQAAFTGRQYGFQQQNPGFQMNILGVFFSAMI